jgi:hypothetical protein
MILGIRSLNLIAMTLLVSNVITAQQPQNQESAAEAATRRHAELAKIERITVEELKSKLSHKEGVFILDVRMPDDYAKAVGKIAGSVRISPFDLKTRMNEVPRDKDVVTYCT